MLLFHTTLCSTTRGDTTRGDTTLLQPVRTDFSLIRTVSGGGSFTPLMLLEMYTAARRL